MNRCLNISKEHYSFLRHRSLTHFFFIYKANKPCGIAEASGGVRKSSTPQHHAIGALRNDDERTCERRRSCKKSMINAFHPAVKKTSRSRSAFYFQTWRWVWWQPSQLCRYLLSVSIKPQTIRSEAASSSTRLGGQNLYIRTRFNTYRV